jgi:hypothetical protein
MNRVSLVVATPMYAGQCFGAYTAASLNLNTQCLQRGVPCRWIFVFNESLITRARNYLVKRFLETDATHLLFVDADIGFRPEDVFRMLEADRDILCGVYPRKEIDWERVRQAAAEGASAAELERRGAKLAVNLLDREARRWDPDGPPVEVRDGGAGFMLIKRHVFDALAPAAPAYRSNVQNLYFREQQGEEIREYFATSIEPKHGVLLSEDYHFCALARRLGFRIFAAPWARLSHIGTYAFQGGLG